MANIGGKKNCVNSKKNIITSTFLILSSSSSCVVPMDSLSRLMYFSVLRYFLRASSQSPDLKKWLPDDLIFSMMDKI